MIHPKIYFAGSHVPSPWDSFFLETRSSPGWFVISGGVNMEWIPRRRHRDTSVGWSLLWLFVSPVKLSRDTSTSVTFGVDDDGWAKWCYILFRIIFSNVCGGRGSPILISFLITLQAVSMLEQKKGSHSHQPIYRLLGDIISMSSMESTGFIKGST